ncbi:hypothetical protein P3X46_018643 [Hevea brasiliensis]|uniref:Uncharacterized protein n=1 Tax=Hevea brasiliensis TaxID=3981 RepID=A0ABQ9LV57_HEVBR|nr:uncharacterized protein LOC110652919 [Hevea brasiliensis]KAJ9170543.1 hypothetical protein P3X46_018643 [Hevea brasiliensis]
MATKKPSKQSKLRKFIKAPIRILIKARDIYIKSMTECSDRLGYGTVMGCPTGQVVNHLPKSFSVNSTKSSNHDDDYRQLLRAASTRGLSNRVQLDVLQRQQSQSPKSPNTCREANHMPRSHSVGIGRIDEEKPCDFDEDDIKVITDVFPRSRSYAVSKTRAGVF